ncbi:degenerin mec-10 [Caerostris extrusa]|uniref:Degenerin mec-10 n=1 Tax=Caerostris extrusa TaxID=172846 RepID=A0AAV4WKG6_CAEEX|nr:degenerin mec-10 [Caerostris extrusa]
MNFNDECIPLKTEGTGLPLLFSEGRSLYRCKNERIESNSNNKSHYSTLEALKEWYEKKGEVDRFLIGHMSSEFLVECSFEGKICPQKYIHVFINFRYGNCITINKKYQDKEHEIFRTSNTGVGSGLILKLNLETEYYLPSTHTVGAKVIIHDPSEDPNPEEEGYILTPGYENLISVRQTIVQRLPAPYKDHCTDYETEETASIKNKNECIRACIQGHNFCTMRLR